MAERSTVEILLHARGGRQVEGETRQATRGVQNLEHASKRAHATLGALGKGAAVAGAALGYGLYRGAKASVQAFAESEKVGAQTAAVLKSTGGAANVSKTQIQQYAAQLSKLSGIDDEAIQSGENMILTFRNIRGQAFGTTIKAAVDMSRAFTSMGKSMSITDASLQLGKAINDPAKGMSRLQRIGVTFTDSQIAQVKRLQKDGNLAAAQKVITDELGKEFGGSAAAYGKTTAGSMERLHTDVENIKEAVGMGLAPVVKGVADQFDKLATSALPDMASLSKRLDRIMGRKDLDMAGKLALSSRETKRAFAPLARQIQAAVKSAHLDDRLEELMVWAAPKMADGAAKAAPRVVKAFVNAWWHAGPWGKLVTAAFLAKKMGAFGWAGEYAAGKFATRYAESAGAGAILKGAAGRAGGVSAGAFLLRFAKVVSPVVIASIIAKAVGVENADPLLFLNPPKAGETKKQIDSIRAKRGFHFEIDPHNNRRRIRVPNDSRDATHGRRRLAAASQGHIVAHVSNGGVFLDGRKVGEQQARVTVEHRERR